MSVYRGKVTSFDNSAWTASVRLDGSAAQTIDDVAVASDIAETDMDVGNKVLVDTGDHNHPSDFVVTVAWPGPPAAVVGDGFPPTGSIVAWPTATAPSLWLLCDGSAVSRATYAALFALIGTVYGAGDGTTTFNVPNLKGRAIVGFDSTQTEFDALGETGGSKTHTLITAEMPAHGHTQDSHGHTQDTHNHTQNAHLHVQDTHNHLQNQHLHVQDPHSHGMAEGQTDGAGVLMDRSNAASATTATTDAATAVNQNTTPTNVTTVAVNQNTTPTNNTTVATNQGTVATNQSTGGGGAHNNLQPYIALNYVIKT